MLFHDQLPMVTVSSFVESLWAVTRLSKKNPRTLSKYALFKSA